jgi:branched-chain amino acid transport system ATP-binding protein
MILEVRNISVSYGGIRAITDVSMEIGEGEIVSIIGANGAGKSTMLRTISGLLKPNTGGIFLENREITGLPPHKIAALGIAHVPEGRGIFYNLTVMEKFSSYSRVWLNGGSS